MHVGYGNREFLGTLACVRVACQWAHWHGCRAWQYIGTLACVRVAWQWAACGAPSVAINAERLHGALTRD